MGRDYTVFGLVNGLINCTQLIRPDVLYGMKRCQDINVIPEGKKYEDLPSEIHERTYETR